MRKQQFSIGELFLEGSIDKNGVYVSVRDVKQLDKAVKCFGAGAPSNSTSGYAIGAEYTNVTNGAKYVNTGTAASSTWSLVGTLSAGSVALANLAAGITPSHVVKYAAITTPAADGTGTIAITVTGAAATDIPMVTVAAAANAVYVKTCVCTTNTLTVVLSWAGGAGTSINYSLLRAAA